MGSPVQKALCSHPRGASPWRLPSAGVIDSSTLTLTLAPVRCLRQQNPALRPGRRGGSSSKLSQLHVSGSRGAIQVAIRRLALSRHSHIVNIRRKLTYLVESLGSFPKSVVSLQNNIVVVVSKNHGSPFLPDTWSSALSTCCFLSRVYGRGHQARLQDR